jgi:hypothetical protein
MIESIENIRGGNYKDIIILTGTLGKEDKVARVWNIYEW